MITGFTRSFAQRIPNDERCEYLKSIVFLGGVNQLGDVTPDCDTALLKRAFLSTQRLLRERVLLAGHDRSDGGLLTTVLEMCLGGDCGCVMEATTENSVMEFLFNEELGLVVEVDDACDREDAGGEPREGERERRGGAGRGREGAARPVGGDVVRAGQAAVDQRRMSMKCVTA